MERLSVARCRGLIKARRTPAGKNKLIKDPKESVKSTRTMKEIEGWNELIDRVSRLNYRNQKRYVAVPGSPTECVPYGT